MTTEPVKSVLAALDKAKDSPMDDLALMAARTEISKFEMKHSNPKITYYTRLAMAHLSRALKYKQYQKRAECVEIADDQFRNRVPSVLRELTERGESLEA